MPNLSDHPLIQDRIAVCSWSLQPSTPSELANALHELSLPRVQLALSPVLRDPDTWSDAIDLLRDRGVSIISGMMEPIGEDYSTLASIRRTGGIRPNTTWPENRDHAAALAKLAQDNGLSLITLHAGFLPEEKDDPERETMIERLQTIADRFAEHDITLGLETGQETAETLCSVLKAIDRSNVAVNFDPANMILYGMGEPLDALRELKSHVTQIHIKDARPSREADQWGEEVVVGDGDVPWREFLQLAMTIDPPVNLVIEREAGDDRRGDIRLVQQRLHSYAPDG